MQHQTTEGKYEIPRWPSAYHPSTHFVQMRKERSDPPVTGEIIDNCIKHGEVRPSKKGDCYYIFNWRDAVENDWRLVVALQDEAFRRPDRTHVAVTIYAWGEHDYQEWREKWD